MAEKAKRPPSTLRTLQAATKGLLYPSESDRPIKAFVWKPEDTKGATTAEDAIAAVTGADKAKLKGLSLAEFFAPMVTEQAWHGDEEKAAVARAKALVEAISKTLTEARAYRVESNLEIPAYAVGKDASGNWAGVSTVLVET
jgi:histidine triad (HIT) family protein